MCAENHSYSIQNVVFLMQVEDIQLETIMFNSL